MVATLILALALQVAGSVITGWEVWQGQRRWRATFGPRLDASGTAVGTTRTTGWAIGVSPEPEHLTVEDRLERLAERQRQDHVADVMLVREVEKSIPAVAAEQANKVEERLQPQIATMLQYLAGMGQRHKWMPWWLGPVLLALGSILGTAAGIVTVL